MLIYCICTQYLVGAPFALITASIRRGMELISLWHCWGGMEAQVSLTVAFSSSAFFGLLFLIFLLTIPHRFSLGFRSGEFAGQSSTPTPWSFNQLLVTLAVLTGAKSCWKMKSASLKSCLSPIDNLYSNVLYIYIYITFERHSSSASVHSLWSSTKFLNRFCLTILIRLQFSRSIVHLFLPHFSLHSTFC